MYPDFEENKKYLTQELRVKENFDIVSREIVVGGKKAVFFFIDGFCKDELMEKLLQYLIDKKPEDMPSNIQELSQTLPYVEVDSATDWDEIIKNIFCGVFALLIDGYKECILIDSRTYPARGVEEPEKDKVLRGSKDGFIETIVFNTALIRRRIRSTDLRMEILSAGKTSKTDIVLCYMDSRVDQEFLSKIRNRIQDIKVDALTMNQESLAECLFTSKWYNPFPKFKYTERPDTATAQILEGNIIILVDNSPSAMILPISILDAVEEADDYYFPPITGTYFRFTRVIVTLVALFLTPVYLLFAYGYVDTPKWLEFIIIKDTINVPILAQLLILEVAIDGMKLAAVNTPDMLNTPLSIIIGVVLGDAAVSSGWFNNEIMLYMAFVAFANFTHGSFELGYALKFLRIFLLLTTSIFGLWGFIGGVIIILLLVAFNKTVSNESYIYPLIPFNGKKLINIFIRRSKTHMNN